MADKYHSIHTGQAIDSAVTKALNPSTTFNSEDAGKLADAKAVGELVNAEKERAEATYLPYDGYSQLARVGEADVADNLTPYSSDSGTSQDTPFILQGSGCANGEEQADTGSYCQLQRKNGNTVTVNQLLTDETEGTTTVAGAVTKTVANHKITLSGTATTTAFNAYLRNIDVIYGHKYLLFTSASGTMQSNSTWQLYTSGSLTANYEISAPVIVSTVSSGTGAVLCAIYNEATIDATLLEPRLIDLTLWFGSNDKIPTHLLNHPEDFFRYYQGDLSYNVGTLTDCNGRYLKTTGRNVWDEQWESGGINYNTGAKSSDPNRIRSKDYIQVIPNSEYYVYAPLAIAVYFYDSGKNYLGNGTWSRSNSHAVPSNACFMMFSAGGSSSPITTYNHDITISLYYEGESGYDQYYPYEELANIDTGNEPLLAFDYKTPDGMIHRDTLKVNGFQSSDVSSTGIEHPSYTLWRIVLTSTAPVYNKVNSYANMKCNKYEVVRDYQTVILSDKTIAISGEHSNNILLNDSSLTTAESVMTVLESLVLEIELNDASKTTEQGTPFPENVAIDDFGTMAFDCPNGVPQGNLIFYPVDYKAEIDTLHNITEGDMHKIALKGDNLAPTDPDTIKGVVDAYNALYAINQEACAGTLRNVLCAMKNLSFNDTDCIYLGTLTFSLLGGTTRPTFVVEWRGASSTVPNRACSKYQVTQQIDYTSMPDKTIQVRTDAIYICDTDYTNATAFNNAMKGVLLAYEKATT